MLTAIIDPQSQFPGHSPSFGPLSSGNVVNIATIVSLATLNLLNVLSHGDNCGDDHQFSKKSARWHVGPRLGGAITGSN